MGHGRRCCVIGFSSLSRDTTAASFIPSTPTNDSSLFRPRQHIGDKCPVARIDTLDQCGWSSPHSRATDTTRLVWNWNHHTAHASAIILRRSTTSAIIFEAAISTIADFSRPDNGASNGSTDCMGATATRSDCRRHKRHDIVSPHARSGWSVSQRLLCHAVETAVRSGRDGPHRGRTRPVRCAP